MITRDILKAESLAELLNAIDDFCKEAIVRDNDDVCMELKERLDCADGNDYFIILSSYMAAADNGDEVVDALCEFAANCRTFEEPEDSTAEQMTKEEFEAVLDEYETKCAAVSCIKTEYGINVAEIPMQQKKIENTLVKKNNAFNILLPKLCVHEDRETYISNLIGTMIYEVINVKLSPRYILQEIHRYIPESREYNKSAKELFCMYFRRVLRYKSRKPGIYTHFDEHMQNVIVMEFYKRVIQAYINYENCGDMPATH